MLSNNWGMEGLSELARPVDDAVPGGGASSSIDLAVPHYHPQGMCCLEVIFRDGLPVRASPSSQAAVLGTQLPGEYIFVQQQNFDGWVKLAGEDGWVLSYAAEYGDLLQQRSPLQVKLIDVWALCDLWTLARKVHGALDSRQVKQLKELEESVQCTAGELFEGHAPGRLNELVASGALTMQDLGETELRIRQRLFANSLVQALREQEVFQELAAKFTLSDRVLPLPTDETLETGEEHEWFAFGSHLHPQAGADGNEARVDVGNLQPIEIEGHELMISETGVLFQPPNEVPVGIWNEHAKRVEPMRAVVEGEDGNPIAVLSYWGQTFFMDAEQRVLDVNTHEVVGIFNTQTMQIDPFEPEVAIATAADAGGTPAPRRVAGDEAEMLELLDRAKEKAALGRFKTATLLFERALRACEKLSAVDVDVECDIIRGRAACWKELGCTKELSADADRLLSIDSADAQAQEWKRLAAGPKVGLKVPQR